MSIRIESVRLENVGRFDTEYQLTFGDASNPAVVVGGTDTGKTTIINAIQFCLGGGVQSQTSSLNSSTLAPVNVLDQRSFGETVHGGVAVTMTDTASDTRYRLTRGFQTTKTRDGPEDAIQPVRGGKEENETWVSTDSEQIINAVYPPDARPFLILNSTITAGIQPQDREIDFDRLVDRLHRAAVSQANARAELSLSSAMPEHQLRDVLLNKINDLFFVEKFGRDPVEVDDGSLIVVDTEYNFPVKLAAGDKAVLSRCAALAAAELLPETPPLLTDSTFGYLDLNGRENMITILEQSKWQSILFGVPTEFADLDITPHYELSNP